jgi:cation-transporting ATPase E
MSNTKKKNTTKKKKVTNKPKHSAKKTANTKIPEETREHQEIEVLDAVLEEQESIVLEDLAEDIDNEENSTEVNDAVVSSGDKAKSRLFEKRERAIKAPRIIPKEEEKKANNKNKKEEVFVERYEASFKTGLTEAQVKKRIEEGKTNVVVNKNTKTYRSIILGNIFTFFNMLTFFIAGALISVGLFKDCLFLTTGW